MFLKVVQFEFVLKATAETVEITFLDLFKFLWIFVGMSISIEKFRLICSYTSDRAMKNSF